MSTRTSRGRDHSCRIWLLACLTSFFSVLLVLSGSCAVALQPHHVQDDGVMDDPVEGRHRRHRMFENPLPFGEDEVRRNSNRSIFVSLGQEGKQDLHFVALLLQVADVIQDHASKTVELAQLLGQPQVAFGREQALHEAGRTGPQHRLAALHQLVPHRREDVTFSHAWLPHGHYVDRLLQEGTALQPFDLEPQRGWEALQVERAKGLLPWQPRLVEQPLYPPLTAQRHLLLGQRVEIGFMRQTLFGGFEREFRKSRRHAAQVQALQEVVQIVMTIRHALRHGSSWMAASDHTPSNRAAGRPCWARPWGAPGPAVRVRPPLSAGCSPPRAARAPYPPRFPKSWQPNGAPAHILGPHGGAARGAADHSSGGRW